VIVSNVLDAVTSLGSLRVARKEHGFRGGRQHGLKALVVVAVEVRGAGSGRLHMQVINVNRPGVSGDSVPWKGWGHVREFVEEVPGRAA